MSKAYEIRTVEELAKVATSDNLEVLKNDIGMWLDLAVLTKELHPGVKFQTEVFKWNDDGKKGVDKITLTVTDDPTPINNNKKGLEK